MAQYLDTTLQLLTLGGVVFAVYKSFRDPDIEASKEIAVMKATCNLKHGAIDNDILLIKNNHLKHIEEDISEIKSNQIKIFTILEERYKK